MYHDIKFSEKEQAKVNMKAEDFNVQEDKTE
jgi:hypothetical protein